MTIRDPAGLLATRLLGTPDSIELACEQLGLELDLDEAEDLVVDANLERCPVCDWWCEAGELVDPDGDVGPCDSCRPTCG